jgi:hypothetical protein
MQSVDRNVVVRRIPELCVTGVLLACDDDDEEEEEDEVVDKAGKRGCSERHYVSCRRKKQNIGCS